MPFKYSKAFSSFSVDDLAKAKHFYGEVLGLKVMETPEGLELHLAGVTMPVTASAGKNQPSDIGPGTPPFLSPQELTKLGEALQSVIAEK